MRFSFALVLRDRRRGHVPGFREVLAEGPPARAPIPGSLRWMTVVFLGPVRSRCFCAMPSSCRSSSPKGRMIGEDLLRADVPLTTGVLRSSSDGLEQGRAELALLVSPARSSTAGTTAPDPDQPAAARASRSPRPRGAASNSARSCAVYENACRRPSWRRTLLGSQEPPGRRSGLAPSGHRVYGGEAAHQVLAFEPGDRLWQRRQCFGPSPEQLIAVLELGQRGGSCRRRAGAPERGRSRDRRCGALAPGGRPEAVRCALR